MVVASNAAFLPAVALCFWNRFYAQALIWAAVTAVSTAYHSCQVYPSTCLASLFVHFRVDVLFSFTVAISVAMMLAYPFFPIPLHLEFGLAGLYFLANVCLALVVPPTHFSQYVLASGAAIALLIGSVLAFFLSKRERKERRKRPWRKWFAKRTVVPMYVFGIISMLLGMFMYFCPAIFDPALYSATHIFWHLGVGVGASMVLYSIWPYVCEVKGCGGRYRAWIRKHWRRKTIRVRGRRKTRQ